MRRTVVLNISSLYTVRNNKLNLKQSVHVHCIGVLVSWRRWLLIKGFFWKKITLLFVRTLFIWNTESQTKTEVSIHVKSVISLTIVEQSALPIVEIENVECPMPKSEVFSLHLRTCIQCKRVEGQYRLVYWNFVIHLWDNSWKQIGSVLRCSIGSDL